MKRTEETKKKQCDYYHGTTVPGLTELEPHTSQNSRLKAPVVHLTTSRQLALHYIWDASRLFTKMPMLRIRDDGVLVFTEMFSGALSYFYKGVSGYIYHCVGDYEVDEENDFLTCAVSHSPVPVMEFEYINDVYKEMMTYHASGTFIYEKYESLPQYRYDIIRGIVIRRIKSEKMFYNYAHPHYNFFKEKFPQYWKEAVVLHKHKLL